MGTKPLLQCYLFFALTGIWLRVIGPVFRTFTDKVQQGEARFQAHHSRAVNYGEEISLLRGGTVEASLVQSSFSSLRGHLRSQYWQVFCFDSVNQYYSRQMGILAAFTCMMPAVYRASAKQALYNQFDPTEYFLSALHSIVHVGMAVGSFFSVLKSIPEIRQLAKRVNELVDALATETHENSEREKDGGLEEDTESSFFEISGMDVISPSGQMLIKDLNLTIKSGESLLIQGPNGSGKTTLLRILSGVRPPAGGIVRTPCLSKCFALPQRSYLIPKLPLREQLLYPKQGRADAKDGKHTQMSGSDSDTKTIIATDEEILAVLKQVNLQHLAVSVTDLDSTTACQGLSGGEQQRVGLARMLLAKPVPLFALLDESTNAIDASFDVQLMAMCQKLGVTCISVSHNTEMRRLHDRCLVLTCNGTGTYKVLQTNLLA